LSVQVVEDCDLGCDAASVGDHFLIFRRNFEKNEEYDAASGTNGETIENSQNLLEPRFTLGLGGLTFSRSGAFTFSGDLEYHLRLRAYDNEYSYFDGTTNKVSTVSGLNNNGAITENGYHFHQIMPSLAGAWNKDNLQLRIQLRLPVTIQGDELTAMGIKADGSLENHGVSSSTTTVGVAPQLRLAARWTIVPKLALTAGGRITVNAISLATSEGKSYQNGNEDANSSFKGKNYTFGSTTTALALGVTLNATDNLSFEASSGIQATNAVSVFDPNSGLFRFGNILATLRF
jgi:hypothetical protein